MNANTLTAATNTPRSSIPIRHRPAIQGSGEEGKLMLIKDSYGNTFAQFPVEDYTEVHVIDLRFFRDDIAEYAKTNGITDTIVLYGVQNFVKDTNLS